MKTLPSINVSFFLEKSYYRKEIHDHLNILVQKDNVSDKGREISVFSMTEAHRMITPGKQQNLLF